MSTFKLLPFDKRRKLATKILAEYPSRIPVILDCSSGVSPDFIRKNKFIVPEKITVAQFLIDLRKQITVNKSQAIFIFYGKSTKNKIAPTFARMADLYSSYADEDGFLYLTVALENTFGF